MKDVRLVAGIVLAVISAALPNRSSAASPLDDVLARENAERGVTQSPAPLINDLAYLRRVYVDLIGRIPTHAEIQEFQAWPSAERKSRVVDQLLNHPRFADRWTAFYADMLRLRSNSEGGDALIAWVHNAVDAGTPYDEMCRRLISTNGKVGKAPEIGWVLGDNADPMALAGATSQVFLGIRIACAQCHDHPFDVWTQEDFYKLAAYFGKTRREERRFDERILAVYTTDVAQSSVLWPPEGSGEDSARKPMQPGFPFELASAEEVAGTIARLAKLRAPKKPEKTVADAGPSVDDLLSEADSLLDSAIGGKGADAVDIASDAKDDIKRLNIQAGRYRDSELRSQLADLITDPRNRFFARSFVNRVWSELLGHGIVEPIDDFSQENPPSHPRLLDYLADEFVARGFDLRSLVRDVVTSDAYARGQMNDVDEATRIEAVDAFLATPMRRMMSESLYDSIVVAGHLETVKHAAGQNLKTVWQQRRVVKRYLDLPASSLTETPLASNDGSGAMEKMPAGRKPGEKAEYNLEAAIELDFDALLTSDDETVQVEKMMVKSEDEIEAERMLQEQRRRQAEYVDRFERAVIDDNPQFNSALRMQTPAPDGHFLRVFGQPARLELGDRRDEDPSMRQALMMLNGRLTHEAARVGELEPIYPLLAGEPSDLNEAVRLIYLELLTRTPTADEIADAKAIIGESASVLDGVADLRWVLLNGHEFRFLP